MLKIKLIRFGKRNQPHYRIVVQEARTKRDGKYTAKIGHYAPTDSPKVLEIDMDAYREWVKKGAQPTETVAHLAKRFESKDPFPKKKKKLSKKAKAKKKAEAEAKEAKKEEKPKEEVKPESETKPKEEIEAEKKPKEESEKKEEK